jgi:acetyltransferase-like isoleucine patch superfamily enzyme
MRIKHAIRDLVGRGGTYLTWRKLVMWNRRRKWGAMHIHPLAWLDRTVDIRSDIEVGPYAFVGPFCMLMRGVVIGKYTMLGPRVAIFGADHFYDKPGIPSYFTGRPRGVKTEIQDDVWIGYGCFIKQGVTIGRGAIVGACAVVTKNVPAYEIWGGNPARKIGERFQDPVDRIKHDLMLAGPLVEPRWPDPI